MAIPGPKPKPPGQTVHRNPTAYGDAWIEVENIPNDDAPHRLPRLRPNGDEWLEVTRRKWQAWRRMPHTRLWTEADWTYCIDSAEVAARFHEGNAAAAAELRSREAVMGTTLSARLGLRIRYVEPKTEAKVIALVPDADEFRDL